MAKSSAYLNTKGEENNPICYNFAAEEDRALQASVKSADQNIQETVNEVTEPCQEEEMELLRMLSMKGDRDPEHKEHSEQVTRQSTWMKSRRPGESDPRTLGNKEALLLLNAQLLPLELKSSCSWAESWGGRQTPHHLQTEDCRTENKSH